MGMAKAIALVRAIMAYWGWLNRGFGIDAASLRPVDRNQGVSEQELMKSSLGMADAYVAGHLYYNHRN